jgi:hypothetical protein
MNWKGFGMEQLWPDIRYYPSFLEGAEESMKTSEYLVSWPRFELSISQI